MLFIIIISSLIVIVRFLSFGCPATAASAKSSSLVSSPTVGKSSSTLTRATKSTPCNVELLRNLDLTFSFAGFNHLNLFLESVAFQCLPHGQLYNDSDWIKWWINSQILISDFAVNCRHKGVWPIQKFEIKSVIYLLNFLFPPKMPT